MTASILYSIGAFLLGLAIGWIVFRPKNDIEDEVEDEEDEEYSPASMSSMEEGLVEDEESSDEDDWQDDDLCNGCLHLACNLPQRINEDYEWKCQRTGKEICFTKACTASILRPDWCSWKND